MTRKGFLSLYFFALTQLCFSQKPGIDSAAYRIWPDLSGPVISNNGKYVAYNIRNRPIGGHTLMLQSTDGKWKRSFSYNIEDDFGWPAFTADSKYAVFLGPADSLNIFQLGTSAIDYIPHVKLFNSPAEGNGSQLIYTSTDREGIVLLNLSSRQETSYTNIKKYVWGSSGKVLLLLTQSGKNPEELYWVETDNGNRKKIWEGNLAQSLILDEAHRQIAFLSKESYHDGKKTTLWLYKEGSEQAMPVLNDKPLVIGNTAGGSLKLASIDRFAEDGNGIFLKLKTNQKNTTFRPDPRAVPVDVWTYMDKRLISQQQKEGVMEDNYLAIFHFDNRKLIQLEFEDEFCEQKANEFAVLTSMNSRRRKYFLVNTSNGKRRATSEFAKISPDGKFLVYYDRLQNAYISFEIQTGVARNLTEKVNTDWDRIYGYDRTPGVRGIAAWTNNNKAVLIYDKYDIWQFDLARKSHPINLTNRYGVAHHILFCVAKDRNLQTLFLDKEKIIVNAFNRDTKDNGFYAAKLDKAADPELLTMGAYLYDVPSDPGIPWGANFPPIKARDEEVCVVRRQSATAFPNYFSTTDFKHFIQLTQLEPQTGYNWYTTELHRWRSLDGRILDGILYKPENFDPHRKYPVIIHYYEKKADGLNAYFSPAVSNGAVDIPTFVSNGYLVFTPDIHYTLGDPMQGTYDAVVSAAHYLSKLPFVNGKKMGIQGWSFGGQQTNFLVTHTNLFAAAAETAGLTDLVSHYGEIVRNGTTTHDYLEIGQGRMAGTLWDKPDLYIKNSPIFNADKVTTPLLMMNNKGDDAIPFQQAIELFTALRRLGKKVWLLQYDGQGHGVHGKAAEDFSMRLMQFFDHYLKDKPAPIWMTRGIPDRLKGIERGLEYDKEITTPPDLSNGTL
jgi:dipeptidyl aminopeptidase/acylaminoacyl peptidase